MAVSDKLASTLNRRDEEPNVALAEAVARKKDRAAVAELVGLLETGNAGIRSDCIKVLYEIGEREPALIVRHAGAFATLLTSKQQRLVWGAMTALDAIAKHDPAAVGVWLDEILLAAECGSVIARDHAVGILVALCASPKFARRCRAALLEQLARCPDNQMYAEKAQAVLAKEAAFETTLTRRMKALPKASQKKRVEKVLRWLDRAPLRVAATRRLAKP